MGSISAMHIKWSEPHPIENVIDNLTDEIGLYYITRKYNGVETSLYIGKSADKIKNRLSSHNDGWLKLYSHSKIFARIGTITYPEKVTANMINDAESALIFEHGCGTYGTKILVENSDKIKSYSYHKLYRIKNYGDFFQLRPIVDMSCHSDYE